MRAAVIGSGFGGLSLAIRLQTAGIQTTVFEARDLPGGRAYVYKDKGYTFQNTYAKPFFTYDLDKPNTSNCNGHCAEVWVPVYPFSQHPTDIGDFTLVNRTDGSQQWAYKGKPLYTFGFGDHEPPTEKDTQGQWHILQP